MPSTRRRAAATSAPKQHQRVVLNVTAPKYSFLMELLGSFSFVQVEENEGGDTRREQDVAKDLEVSLLKNFLEEENIAAPTRQDIAFFRKIAKSVAKDAALIEAEKLKTRSLNEFLDEL